jgi:hypothetical protein
LSHYVEESDKDAKHTQHGPQGIAKTLNAPNLYCPSFKDNSMCHRALSVIDKNIIVYLVFAALNFRIDNTVKV